MPFQLSLWCEHHAFVIETYLKNGDYHCSMVISCHLFAHQICSLVITNSGNTWRHKSLNVGQRKLTARFCHEIMIIPRAIIKWALQVWIAFEGKDWDDICIKTKWIYVSNSGDNSVGPCKRNDGEWQVKELLKWKKEEKKK